MAEERQSQHAASSNCKLKGRTPHISLALHGQAHLAVLRQCREHLGERERETVSAARLA